MNTEEKEQAKTKHKPLNHHGHAIRRLRQDKGLSQNDLASLLGMSRQALSRYEAQEVVNDDILKQVAKGLDVSVDLIKELEEDKSLAFYVENNTFSGNALIMHAANDESTIYQIDETPKALLEEVRKTCEEARLQYENIIVTYKQMLESCQQENKALKEKIAEKNA